MGFGESEEIRLVVDGEVSPCPSSSSCSICQCRICHEEEEEHSTSMESPCACSGTLKFAHRGCIQRWCDEKGSTICEICLQKFEPGYTVAIKKAQLVDVAVTIRDSLTVPRQNYGSQNPGLMPIAGAIDEEAEFSECSSHSDRSASCYRSVALTFTVLLLVRHLIAVLTVGANHYAFTLVTVFALRASGILVPFYIVMRVIAAIQHTQWQQQQEQLHGTDDSSLHGVEEDDDELQQHTIQIDS